MKQESQDSFKKFIHSFKYAIDGLKYAFKSEQNFKFHILVTFLILILGIVLKITKIERIITLLLIGQVISLELVNTAIERTVDLETLKIHPLARVAKDTSAASVLVSAIISVIVGIFIYLPYILEVIK